VAASCAVADMPHPDLVWSGPEVPGLHARDTRRVYEELVVSAEHSLWISTYAYYDGPQAFKSLAARMQAAPKLQVALLLNIQRRPADTAPPEQLVVRFAERLWHHDWPGSLEFRDYAARSSQARRMTRRACRVGGASGPAGRLETVQKVLTRAA